MPQKFIFKRIDWEFITIIVNTTFREWYWNIQCVKASCIWNGCLWRGYSICTSSHMLFFLCQSLCLSSYNTRHHLAVRFSQQLANCFVIGTILVLSLEPKSISGGRRRGWKKWRIPEHNMIKHWQSQGGVKVQFFSRPDLFSSHINGMEGEGEVQEASPEREGAQVWG